jgi:WD40 repeat protein
MNTRDLYIFERSFLFSEKVNIFQQKSYYYIELESDIKSMAFSKEGRRLAVGSSKSEIYVFDFPPHVPQSGLSFGDQENKKVSLPQTVFVIHPNPEHQGPTPVQANILESEWILSIAFDEEDANKIFLTTTGSQHPTLQRNSLPSNTIFQITFSDQGKILDSTPLVISDIPFSLTQWLYLHGNVQSSKQRFYFSTNYGHLWLHSQKQDQLWDVFRRGMGPRNFFIHKNFVVMFIDSTVYMKKLL